MKDKTISIIEHLGTHEEKFVLQLFDDKKLLDEKLSIFHRQHRDQFHMPKKQCRPSSDFNV